MDRGIVLAGGGALLTGLDERLRHETQMPVHLAESPLTCVAVGSGRSLEEFEAIHRSNKARSRNGRRTATSALADSTARPGLAVPLSVRASQPLSTRGGAGLARLSAPPPRTPRSRGHGPLMRRLVVAVLVLASLALITVSFREAHGGALHGAQSAGATVLRPFQVAAERVARPFRDAYATSSGLVDAKSENEKLRAEVDQLRAAGDPERDRAAARTRSCEPQLRYVDSPRFPRLLRRSTRA